MNINDSTKKKKSDSSRQLAQAFVNNYGEEVAGMSAVVFTMIS